MDFLDLIKPKQGFVLTGSYRPKPKCAPMYFEYKTVDYQSARYSEIINNIIATQQGLVVRTIWDCDWQVNGYVSTQDGKLWAIQQVQKDNKNSEVLRTLTENPSDEFLLALIGVDNPEGIV